MEGVLERNISTALKAIAEAIKLDSNNKHVEAYWQYIQSITFIVKCLSDDFANKGGQQFQITTMTKKFIKLGQQSMERLGAVLENIGAAEVPLVHPDPASSSDRIPTPTDPFRKKSPSFHQQPDSLAPSSLRMDLSPMEQAQLTNKRLISNYRARIARMASPSDKRATEMSLTLQRKLIENAAIAKARQEAVERKLLERRKAIEQEAARRLSSKDDQEFFASVMKYEEKAKWPLSWRERIGQNPKDERLIHLLVEQILRSNDHPITKALLQYQLDIYNKIKPVVDKHLDRVNAISVPYQDDSAKEETNESEGNADSQEEASDSDAAQLVKDLETSLEAENDAKNETDFAKVTEEVKNELAEAEEKGDKVIEQLTRPDNPRENTLETGNVATSMTTSESMASLTTSEDFDDLFDDDEDGADSEKQKSTVTVDIPEAPPADIPCRSDTSAETTPDKSQAAKSEGPTTPSSHKDLTTFQQTINKLVHSCMNKLLWLFIIAYEQLDTADGRDQLYICLEDPFFKQLWAHLLLFFRVVNQRKEVELAKVMTKMMGSSPECFGIREKFCLMGGAQAYFPAVEEVIKIKHFYSPLKKLQCLVNMSRSACQCVEDFYGSLEAGKSPGASLGADDLLPIISFVIVHSEMPQILSECALLEEFIHHGYLYGEEGYCLTTVQTALAYVISLSKKKKISPDSPHMR